MWSSFRVKIDIKASVNELYKAWTTQSGMEYWFLRQCYYFTNDGRKRAEDESFQPGDRYLWRWHGYPDETYENDEILDCNGSNYLQFRFGKAGRCSVRIYEENDTTIVELWQDMIPDTDDPSRMTWHVGCKAGWVFYLANMKSLFEGGIDLRNRNEELKDMANS